MDAERAAQRRQARQRGGQGRYGRHDRAGRGSTSERLGGDQTTRSARQQTTRQGQGALQSTQSEHVAAGRRIHPERVTGHEFDLVVDETIGESWDFLRADRMRACWARLKEDVDGHWVPAVHGIQRPEHWPEQAPERAGEVCQAGAGGQDLVAVSPGHLRLAGAQGAVFYSMHEHLALASSWRLPEVRRVWSMDGVSSTVNDACVFGMVARGTEGKPGPVKKPTRWMGNALGVMRELRRRCAGTHSRHVHLLGGRAAAAAVYPLEFVAALARGIQAQREADARAAAGTLPCAEQINAATAGEGDGFSGAAWRAPGATRDEYVHG